MPGFIEDHGLIRDATTVALISRHGSIDWLCLPRVDSDACFANLLGTDQHGYWKLGPAVALPETWDVILAIVDFVDQAWRRKDEGIWEVRGEGHRHFTHSKLMAWVPAQRH
jgi:GH15 family glucan-1,4-alpha-glucosidase